MTPVDRLARLAGGGDMGALAAELVRRRPVAVRFFPGPVPFATFAKMLDQGRVERLLTTLIPLHVRDRGCYGYFGPLIGGLIGLMPARLPDQMLDPVVAFTTSWGGDYYLGTVRLAQVAGQRRERGPLPPELLAIVMSRSGESQQLRLLAMELAGRLVNPGQRWADRLLAEVPALDPRWGDLLRHAGTAVTAGPSKAWSRRAAHQIEQLGGAHVHDVLGGWLAEVAPADDVDPFNDYVLRGLLWMIAQLPPRVTTVRLLGRIVEVALRRVPDRGPASPTVAAASVYALSRVDNESSLAQLARLSARVTHKGTIKQIDRALEARAAATGMSREDLEELAVPTYGLDDDGIGVRAFGGATARITVRPGRTELTWCNDNGKPVKAAPAAVRRDFSQQLAELRADVKDIDAMRSAQTNRLERFFLARRSWRFDQWRERYLAHPLVSALARRLIWNIDGAPVMAVDGALRTVSDDPVRPHDAATVQIWHPLDQPVPEVTAWRDWLARRQIGQPFKQAYREVYRLAPAEETTNTYSNRFAAHVLRQHQFHALAAARGWRDQLRLIYRDDTPATLSLPPWGLRVELWMYGVGDDEENDATESGVCHLVATDQVRFYSLDPRVDGPVALSTVPALVFSEVMRDVDLFVGVASVGNDPTWQDGGPGQRFRDYWTDYSFGELSATAQTRRDVLARLLPRLAVGPRCTLDDRFLLVRGDLRTYKIHLGSGNVLMSPNDAYLCIVADTRRELTSTSVFLPFEEDRTLSMILSKAMLLANDTKITDLTIIRQIR